MHLRSTRGHAQQRALARWAARGAWMWVSCVALSCAGTRSDAARDTVAAVTPSQGQDAATQAGASPSGAKPAASKPKPAASKPDAGSAPAMPGAPPVTKPTPAEDAGAACDLPCEPPQSCEWVAVQCVRAPCPPQPRCVGERAAVEDCDPRHRTCTRKAPECPFGQVPSLQGGCYGPCIRVERCACDEAEQCPNPEAYTCHRFAHHCGPYVE